MSESVTPVPVPADESSSQSQAAAVTSVPPTHCAMCARMLADEYYEANGKPICPPCHVEFERASRSVAAKIGRLFQATVFGLTAALGGFLIYYTVFHVMQRQWSFLALFAGLLVGLAVRIGSSYRGGLLYQVLAVSLTYSAIVAGYTADDLTETIRQIRGARVAPGSSAQATSGAAEQGNAPGHRATGLRREAPPRRPVLALIFYTTYIVAVFSMGPITEGFKSPLVFVMVAAALWLAWWLNRRVALVLRGPFQLGAPERAPLESSVSA